MSIGRYPAFGRVSENEEMRHVNFKLKKNDKQFISFKALQTQMKNRVKRQLKE